MANDKKTMSVEVAKKVLDENEQKKKQVCLDEIVTVLKKHGYNLKVIEPQITLVASGGA